MKTCPFCAEEIQDAAIVCRYCGNNLSADVHREQEKKKSYLGSILTIIGGILGELYALYIVSIEFGLIGAALALFFFPVAIFVAPLYALFVYGAWFPLIVVYGLIGMGMFLNYRTVD